MTDKLPAVVPAGAVTAAQFLPVLDVAQAIERRNAIVQFTQSVMKDGVDFGNIPGVDKPTLLKPGAEKLVTLFGLSPTFTLEESIEDWTGADHKGEPLFYYRYRCQLRRGDLLIGEGIGSSNSWEKKHRYRWVSELQVPPGLNKELLAKQDGAVSEFAFAIEKGETSGKYGKPAEYWQRFRDAIANQTERRIKKKTRDGREMDAIEIGDLLYRIPNTETADLVNTVQKMGQKRALVAAILIGANASEFFTQDVEDMEIIDVTPYQQKPAAPAAGTGAPAAPAQPAAAAAGTPPPAQAPADAGKKGKGKKGAKNEPAAPAQQTPPPPPPAGAFDVQDACLKMKEAKSISDLVALFNGFPNEQKRPDSEIYRMFQARREEFIMAREQREGRA